VVIYILVEVEGLDYIECLRLISLGVGATSLEIGNRCAVWVMELICTMLSSVCTWLAN